MSSTAAGRAWEAAAPLVTPLTPGTSHNLLAPLVTGETKQGQGWSCSSFVSEAAPAWVAPSCQWVLRQIPLGSRTGYPQNPNCCMQKPLQTRMQEINLCH